MTALTPAGSVDAVNAQPDRPPRRMTALPEPLCTCGHPKARHVKKRGRDWWLQCHWQYEPGNGRCHCGMYRPDDRPAA